MPGLLILDIREADDITCARHLHECITVDNPAPEEIVESADEKVVVISTHQLKVLQFEYYQKWGSQYKARHFKPDRIVGYKLVVTDKKGGSFCPHCGKVHG